MSIRTCFQWIPRRALVVEPLFLLIIRSVIDDGVERAVVPEADLAVRGAGNSSVTRSDIQSMSGSISKIPSDRMVVLSRSPTATRGGWSWSYRWLAIGSCTQDREKT
ncbi:hypothetical protein [Halocatena salina]|uniref:Uncharacterized protein n=1 Tax=Halocatena salina TaxID=2934340 RepID=A0A8U0A7X5_9EURY|nr:hypothetical protein [Halocatena salina]UPM44936.1 hypothetical protein MW046_17910 [Halocatena salina]